MLFGHTDDTGRAAAGAAQARAAHAVGPAAHPNALTDLRVIQHVPRIHRQRPPVQTPRVSRTQGGQAGGHENWASGRPATGAYLLGDGGVWRDMVGTPVVGGI